jgi:hypothetical protein
MENAMRTVKERTDVEEHTAFPDSEPAEEAVVNGKKKQRIMLKRMTACLFGRSSQPWATNGR